MGPDAMILVFWMLSFKPTFSLSSFTFIKRLFNSSLLSAKGWCDLRICSYRYFSWQSWFQLVLHPAWHFPWHNLRDYLTFKFEATWGLYFLVHFKICNSLAWNSPLVFTFLIKSHLSLWRQLLGFQWTSVLPLYYNYFSQIEPRSHSNYLYLSLSSPRMCMLDRILRWLPRFLSPGI